MRTNNRVVAELYEKRTPVIDACLKIQVSTKDKDGKLVTEIVDRPCGRAADGKCAACAFPDKKWRLGVCNLATHLQDETKKNEKPVIITPLTMTAEEIVEKQKRINPIKASKRGKK